MLAKTMMLLCCDAAMLLYSMLLYLMCPVVEEQLPYDKQMFLKSALEFSTRTSCTNSVNDLVPNEEDLQSKSGIVPVKL